MLLIAAFPNESFQRHINSKFLMEVKHLTKANYPNSILFFCEQMKKIIKGFSNSKSILYGQGTFCLVSKCTKENIDQIYPEVYAALLK